MKKFLVSALIVCCSLLQGHAANGVGKSSTDINTVKVELPAVLKIYNGEDFQIGISAKDRKIQEKIKYSIIDSELKIYIDKMSLETLSNIDENDIRIRISVPNDVSIESTPNFIVKTYKQNVQNKTTKGFNN